MKTPRFTDSARYPHGYRDSKQTDVAATFRRVRAEQAKAAAQAAKDEAEREEKLRTLRRRT